MLIIQVNSKISKKKPHKTPQNYFAWTTFLKYSSNLPVIVPFTFVFFPDFVRYVFKSFFMLQWTNTRESKDFSWGECAIGKARGPGKQIISSSFFLRKSTLLLIHGYKRVILFPTQNRFLSHQPWSHTLWIFNYKSALHAATKTQCFSSANSLWRLCKKQIYYATTKASNLNRFCKNLDFKRRSFGMCIPSKIECGTLNKWFLKKNIVCLHSHHTWVLLKLVSMPPFFWR